MSGEPNEKEIRELLDWIDLAGSFPERQRWGPQDSPRIRQMVRKVIKAYQECKEAK